MSLISERLSSPAQQAFGRGQRADAVTPKFLIFVTIQEVRLAGDKKRYTYKSMLVDEEVNKRPKGLRDSLNTGDYGDPV